MQQNTNYLTLKQYVKQQRKLIRLEYELETAEKQKTEIPDIDLYFILRTNSLPGRSKEHRKWTTTLPLPKNLVPPEYLIITDPTFVNVSDKMSVEFLDCTKDPIEGTVMKIRDGELTAVFELDWEENSARHKCCIKFLPNDIVYKRKLNALKKLYNLNVHLQNMLCHKYPTKQNIPKIELYIPSGYQFNESQKKAIRMSVSNPFSLIQGPPGTGKTHTIGAIAIQALHQYPNSKVLICGTTNVSISSLLEIVGDMLQNEGFKVCWPAASSRDFLTGEGLTKEQKLTTLYKCRHMNSNDGRRFKELNDKYNPTEQEIGKMNKLREKLENQIIRESDVIFSTLDSSTKKSIVASIGHISTLIVDEATLSVESSMIIPLSLCPDRLVLVGDHKQLGPQPSFKELEASGYYYSMFERIIKEKLCLKNSVMLNTQYRMHPDISSIPNSLFYDNELIDGVKPENRQISKNFIFQKHLNFINFNQLEERNGTSYINNEEIDLVLKYVNALIDSGVQESQIGVISAYGAQTHLILDNFKWSGLHVKVSTIDSFQGSQKDYIVICTTRNGSNLGFINDKRRMNVAITRARCMATIFGNAETLSQSPSWNEVIQYTKQNNSFYDRLPIKIDKHKLKTVIISKQKDNLTREMVSEFKEEPGNSGYNMKEIYSEISDSKIKILWPDEKNDVQFLNNWVQKRVEILNNKKHVTLSYDAESVCMQFGDIFDENIDYYNWESDDYNVPEIKTDKSIIISFYEHKGLNNLNPILVNIMKPLLEHPNLTLITFDFTFDFDKLYDFDVNIKTKQIIDAQLINLPENSVLNENKDFICSTGWKPISDFIYQVKEDYINSNIITRAKQSVKNGKKKFPHEENNFLIKQYNYPQICQFSKQFLEYSASDIFYTAIVAVNVLMNGELDIVKTRSLNKFHSYKKYRKVYGNVQYVRQAYYVRESFTSAIQAQFSKECKTNQILSYHKKLSSFVTLLDKCPELLQKIIPSFSEDDDHNIRQRYHDILNIMENTEYEHLGNIKDKAILSYVQGITKTPAFVLRFKEEIDEVQEEIKEEKKAEKEKEERDLELINQITGGKNSFKVSSFYKAWTNIDMTKPCEIKQNITVKTFSSIPRTNKTETLKRLNRKGNQKFANYYKKSNIESNSQQRSQIQHPQKQYQQQLKLDKHQDGKEKKQEIPIVIKKAVHSSWINFTKSKEDDVFPLQSSNPVKKNHKSSPKFKVISQSFIPESKPKQLKSSWKEFNNTQL